MSDEAQKQPFWEELGLPAPGARISREDYEALPEVSFHMEWHDGVVVYPHWNEETMSPAPNMHHQTTVMQVIKLLLNIIPDGKLFTAPTDVMLSGRAVQPDVFWVSDSGQAVMEKNALIGPPDLVVEVLSPSTGQRDKTDKFDLYEAQGIREYWIVEPRDNVIEVYVLDGGAYRRLGAFKPGQNFDSPVLGQSVPVTQIFEG